MANEIIIKLPFNGTADGTGTQPGTATLTGAAYAPGRNANQAIKFAGEGRAELVSQYPFPFTATFSFTVWLKTAAQPGGVGACWLLYKFAGRNQFLYIDLSSSLSRWSYVVIIQDTNSVSVYVNGVLKGKELFPTAWGKPTGFAMLSDGKAKSGYLSMQDATLYRGADYTLATDFVPVTTPALKLEYRINGAKFKDYGVHVSASTGVLDNLAMKAPTAYEWPGYNGDVLDLSAPRYESRSITLNCFLIASDSDDFIERLSLFLAQFTGSGTKRLRISAYSASAHVFEVYLPGRIDLKKKWSSSDMVGTFDLTLVEPDPVKMVLSFGIGTASITLTTQKTVSIHWGDGTHTFNVFGTAKTITHTYQTAGPHEIIISGDIDAIKDFSSNAGIVWNRL